MLKEALQEITGAAVKAAGPQAKEIDATKTYAILEPDGTVGFIGDRVPYRQHKAADLETIAAFADLFEKAAIWVSRSGIVLLTDNDDRRDRVSIDMIHSAEILKLHDLLKAPLLDQRATLFMLRTVFTQDALPQFPKLIEVLRAVKFTAGASAEGNVQRGKSSVGKSVTAEATFLDQVPEQITLSVPIFANAFATQRHDVRCALEIYEAEMKLQLFPLPGEVEGACAAAEAYLCGAIRDLLGKGSLIPVFYGSP